jgi:hypothetical protein
MKETIKYNYIALGYDCSTATAINDLLLRDHSLPFDWIVSDLNNIIKCISEDFINFHKELILNPSKTRVIDYYGFEYPHDYPNTDAIIEIEKIGEGQFHEKVINENWQEFIDINLEKYNRRSKRFLDILKSETNLIILYRGPISNIISFKNFMKNKFNKINIKYVVSNKEEYSTEDMVICDTEKNGTWNDKAIWSDAIEKVKML